MSSRVFSRKTFEITPDVYDAAIGDALARWSTHLLAAHDRFPLSVLEYDGMTLGFNALTYLTNGLGVFPLYESDVKGYVSRELVVSVSIDTPRESVLSFIDHIVNALLDAKEAPSIGTCFPWPSVLAHLNNDRFNHVYVGHAFLDPCIRTFSAPGIPETHFMELVPLTEEEVSALERINIGVPEFFAKSGLDPTSLAR